MTEKRALAYELAEVLTLHDLHDFVGGLMKVSQHPSAGGHASSGSGGGVYVDMTWDF
tara:strand:- start:589 stop:759 length:171 start_codon:yes stop_codon:yes gene_type:complete